MPAGRHQKRWVWNTGTLVHKQRQAVYHQRERPPAQRMHAVVLAQDLLQAQGLQCLQAIASSTALRCSDMKLQNVRKAVHHWAGRTLMQRGHAELPSPCLQTAAVLSKADTLQCLQPSVSLLGGGYCIQLQRQRRAVCITSLAVLHYRCILGPLINPFRLYHRWQLQSACRHAPAQFQVYALAASASSRGALCTTGAAALQCSTSDLTSMALWLLKVYYRRRIHSACTQGDGSWVM